MVPNSYATDTQAKATDLAFTLAAAVSPLQIASACSAVEAFLRKHSPDHHRCFFSITFPALICRIFGFDDSLPPSTTSKRHPSNGWIDVATSANDSDLSGRIFSLLSPNGLLLTSISAVDRISLVKYIFPNERLPEWVRYMLQNEHDCLALIDLCPLFRNRIKEDPFKGSTYQVQLNVLEYYLFWFAYYPVCRSNSEGSETVKVQRTKKFRLENWSYSIPGLTSTKREEEKRTECNLYIQLLYAYLHSFVPSQDLYVQPYRSSLLHYSSGYDSSAMEQAAFLINTMIHFWLVDSDFSPLSVSLCKANGVTFPFRSVLGAETSPTSGLGDVITVFVKYLNLSSLVAMDWTGKAEVSSPGSGVSGPYDVFNTRDAAMSINSTGSWNLMIQRPLYRFILRTFLFCPVESSIRNASQAFSLWINYIEPWLIRFEEFADLNGTLGLPTVSSANTINKSFTPGYVSWWQGFVLDNYLFYSSLVMHFIGFAHKFLHTDAEIIVQMVAKVINILTSSVELMHLIKNVDTVFHSEAAAEPSKWMLTGVNRYIPMIRQELQDWEDGLCENDADGSFLHENWNRDLRLFADGEDGGQHLLQLFLLRAESELQSLSGANLSQNLQCLDSLRAQLSQLFGGLISKSPSGTPQSGEKHQPREEIFKPRCSGNKTRGEIKYKGDWMKRPTSSDEIAWLALVLVNLSGWVNEKIGLDRVDQNQGASGWSYLKVPGDIKNVHGTKETMKVVFWSLVSWAMWLGEVVVQVMRRHGLRVNLRILASKRIVAMVLLVVVFGLLKRALALAFAFAV